MRLPHPPFFEGWGDGWFVQAAAAATNIAQGDGGCRAFDRSLGCERTCHDAVAPTFGLNNQAHDCPPRCTMTRYSHLMLKAWIHVYLFCG